MSVRSVCRECGLNTRYFYESFDDVDDLLGAVYDRVSGGSPKFSKPRSGRLTTQCGRARGPASPRCSASARPTRAAGGTVHRGPREPCAGGSSRAGPGTAARGRACREADGSTRVPIRWPLPSARPSSRARWPSSPSSGWREVSATIWTPSSTTRSRWFCSSASTSAGQGEVLGERLDDGAPHRFGQVVTHAVDDDEPRTGIALARLRPLRGRTIGHRSRG